MSHAELVQRHSKFLTRLAIRFSGRIGFEEFYQAGVLGLLEAAQCYDESRGVKFLSFASRYIYHRMIEVLRVLYYPVRIPMHQNKLINKIRKQGHLTKSERRQFGLTDSEAEYFEVFVDPTSRVSINPDISDYGAYEQWLIDRVTYNEISEFVWTSPVFKDKERLVLFLHLGLGGNPAHSYNEIAKKYPDIFIGVSQVRRIAHEAWEKLEEHFSPGGV